MNFVASVQVEKVAGVFVATCPAYGTEVTSRSVKSAKDAALPLLQVIAKDRKLGVPAQIIDEGDQITARWGYAEEAA